METLINFLRFSNNLLTKISAYKFYGIHIDLFLHFIISFILIQLLTIKFTLKKSIYFVTGLLILKELIDVFAKSRLEYIRPPEIEFLVDILFGLLGIGCAVLLIFLKKKKTKIL